MHTGHCLCGAVRYELDFELQLLTNCHCRFCRRAHGAAFVTVTLVPTDALRVTGEEHVARHEGRHFCGTCGTRLWNRTEALPGATVLMVASLDPEPETRPALHFNVESKAPWHEILDDRPQFPSFPESVEAALGRED
jgi:hypothetical protein